MYSSVKAFCVCSVSVPHGGEIGQYYQRSWTLAIKFFEQFHFLKKITHHQR